MTQQSTPKPFYKRWWFLLLAAIVVIGVLGAACSGGGGSTSSATPTSGESLGSETAPAAPAVDDPLSDGDWTLVETVVDTSNPYGSTITGRVVNNSADTETAMLTLTVFQNGALVESSTGFATEVEAGSTTTVVFLFSSALPSGELTYELESDL